MNHRIRLGPLALFLCIMVMIITTIAVLTISTSEADMVMAERFASVTSARYGLEADGERFLSDAEKAAASGSDISAFSGVSSISGGYLFEKSENGYKLEIEISSPDETGSFEVTSYRISRIWRSEDPAAGIWKGN